MDSALNMVIENYLQLTKDLPKLIVLKVVTDILEKYGWENNNFLMPPDRNGLVNDLYQILEQLNFSH